MKFLQLVTVLYASVVSCCVADAMDPIQQFEMEVRPLLEERCFECHGPDKQKGGLRLDQKSNILGAGDSEQTVVVPGNHEASLLYKKILSTDPETTMPPKGKRLTVSELASVRQWINSGAHWPAGKNLEAGENPGKAIITDQDRQFWSFQKPRRSAEELPPQGWARQPFDVLVFKRLHEKELSPANEVDRAAFLRRVTYDLTGLPPSTEELQHFLSDDAPDPFASLVDRLLASRRFGERLASLWLPLARYAEDQAHQVGADTKFFYANAHHYRTWVIGAFNRDVPYDHFLRLQLAADVLPESTADDLAALGFLGLGPKYYNRNRLEVMADEWEDRVDTVTRTMLGLTVSCARCHDHKFDPVTAADYHALAGVFASTRMVNRRPDGSPEKEDTKEQKIHPGTLHVVEEGDLQNLNLFIRGNVTRKGPVVPRRFLEVLSPGTPAPFTQGSGRAELASAITNPANPLTARVMANRLWGHFFAEPLVSTPSNFGHSGARPIHQELLDDLAVRFMENGWSIKKLVRELVLSATYRQSNQAAPLTLTKDPENLLFSRMPRRRLSIEEWRDGALMVSGQLVEETGARSRDLDSPDNLHRTVYARISRLKLNDLLMQFDYPDANVHAEKRPSTITPTQKLFLLNSPFIQARAEALAARLHCFCGDEGQRVEQAYLLLFTRPPRLEETAAALNFLRQPDAGGATQWQRYAQLLLASNEMFYVD